ncbi:MAG: arsenate reductase [Bacteroidetes bacterium HGW-Bacteroidetes-15]|nr:MAG: arsenate reductase [Bacteroidetes bacterium HGW-Bacteroidetes-15]
MLKIYHNSRCKHSRAGLEHLKSKTSAFEVREYLKDPITKEEIREILLKTNLPPSELARTQEDYYKKNLKGRNFNDDEWVKILVDNPKLIKRPIVVGKLKAVIGSTPEEINKMFK